MDPAELTINVSPMTPLPPIDKSKDRFPCCIVWTPIPCLTWFLPFIGHMGIAMSSGIIRDFAGPYYVSEDDMAFGRPTKYIKFDPSNAKGGVAGWDRAVIEASEIYKHRMHNLCCDNCHSHVATALAIMEYNQTKNWNMIRLAILIFFRGKYVSGWGFIKTWLPFVLLCVTITAICVVVGG